MAEIALYLFGHPRLEQNGVEMVVKSRKGLALLAYLAVPGRGQARDTLATLLWPEHSQHRAWANLRNTLYSMGQENGLAGWLDVDAEQIALRASVIERIDVTHFLRLLEAGTIRALHQATRLYVADFLAGFYLPDSAAFEDWARQQQEIFRRQMLRAFEFIAADAMSRKEYREAEAALLRQLSFDDLREETWRQLMTLLSADGRRAEALAAYEQCCQVLATDNPLHWSRRGVGSVSSTSSELEPTADHRTGARWHRQDAVCPGTGADTGGAFPRRSFLCQPGTPFITGLHRSCDSPSCAVSVSRRRTVSQTTTAGLSQE